MKKILLSLLVLFLIGCVPLQPKEELEEGPEEVESYVSEGVGFVKMIMANEYKISPVGSIMVESTKISVESITDEYEVELLVGDTPYVIYETNKPEIVNNIEIIAKEIKYGTTPEKTYVILKAKSYQPKANEYLMHINDKITIGEHTITLMSVDTDTLHSIQLVVDTTDKRLNKGQTAVINNMEVTNVDTNQRAMASEKYAIIRAVSTI